MSILIESYEDHYYTHAISLKHMETSMKRRVSGFLKIMEQDILSQMEGKGLQYKGLIGGVNREARLNAMLQQVRETISTNFIDIQRDSKGFLSDFVSTEAIDQVDLMNSAIRMPLYSVVLTPNAITTLVDTSLIRGAVMSNWWKKQEANTQNRIISQIQLGFAEGEGINEIRERLIGKPTGKWEQIIVNGKKRRVYERVGGIVTVSQREADALARTAVQTLSGQVRTKIYEQNDDIVDQVESVATLDARTTPLCSSYDNLRWTQKGHNPVGHSKRYYSTPRHWNCRSTHIPVMVELEELEKKAREAGIDIPQSMRASIDGPQPAMRSMDDWLKKKPPEFQRKLLGSKNKVKLFRDGKMSLRDLTDDMGEVLSFAQIKKRLGIPTEQIVKPKIDVLKKPIPKPPLPSTTTKYSTQIERQHIQTSIISKTTNLGGGVNVTKVLDNDFPVVFKPYKGESQGLRKSIDKQYTREVAASIIDEELELGLVPTTALKKVPKTGIGSAQKFMKGYIPGMHFPKISQPFLSYKDRDAFLDSVGKEQSERWYMFDTLIANTDRHNNNWMYKREAFTIPGKQGELKIALIDNGLTLPSGGYSLRIPSHLEDLFDDKPISVDCLDRIDKFVENKVEITKRLQEVGLDDEAIKGLFDRAQEFQDRKIYPVRGAFSKKKASTRTIQRARAGLPSPPIPSVTKLIAKKSWDPEDFEYMKQHIDRLQNRYAEIYNDRLVRHGGNTSLVKNDPFVKKAMEELDRARIHLKFSRGMSV